MKTLILSILIILYCFVAQAEEWLAIAYCPCFRCCQKTDGITASGLQAKEGQTIAINWLPFNTRVYIDGKVFYVEDRGAKSIFGDRRHHLKRVDIFFKKHSDAKKFGKKIVDVIIK
jgi:3D (Asp-Asp-Asp) domain-containing protein